MAFNPEATALVALRLVLGVFFIRQDPRLFLTANP
jgi:hypothetical protein